MTFTVFGAKPKDAILVPDLPINVRNNCQVGGWFIGDENYGSKCSLAILKFSKFFGNLGQAQNTLWGQIWCVAESGDLPHGVVFVTYIKTRSLGDFNRLVASVQARGIEPAMGLFIPEFVRHSGNSADGNPINYYSLRWNWEPRKDDSPLEQYANVLNDPANMARMFDMDGTRQMQCLDGMDAESIQTLVNSTSQVPALPVS